MKKASAEEMHKSVYANYAAFIRYVITKSQYIRYTWTVLKVEPADPWVEEEFPLIIVGDKFKM